MADAEVRLILNAIDNASRTVDGVTKSITGLGKANQVAGDFLAVFGVSLDSFTNIAMTAGRVLRQSIDQYAAYGKQVGDVSRQLGVGAEEASKLIQVADDLEINFSTLQMALKTAQKEGVNPTIEGLANLATEYQALETPTQRAQFAMEKFGRAGIEMQKILETSAADIQGMAEQAEQLGLVMDEAGVENALRYRQAMDDLGDAVTGLQNAIGSKLVPVLADAAEAGSLLLTWSQQIDAAQQRQADTVLTLSDSYDEYADKVLQAAVVAGDLTQAEADIWKQSGLTYDAIQLLNEKGLPILSEEMYNLARATAEGTVEQGFLRNALSETGTAADTTTEAIEGQVSTLETLNPLLQSYSDKLLFSKVANELGAEAALSLGLAMGVIDDKTLLMERKLPMLKEQFDANADGMLSAAEAANGYTQAVLDLATQIKNLDGSKAEALINIELTGAGAQALTGGIGNVNFSNVNQERAAGGPVIAGQPYLVGEQGPEMFVPSQNGQIINAQTTQIYRAAPNVNINMETGDPMTAARMMAREITRRM